MTTTSAGRDFEPALVVVPTFDEIESLPGVLDRLGVSLPCADVLVVDDSSPDRTGEWAQARAQTDQRVHVLHRPAKSGLASAYRDGFSWGLARGYESLVEMDADGSHRPEEARKLLARFAAPDHPDVVVGSRWVTGGAVNGWSVRRELLSRAGNLYIRAMLGLGVTDATAGFRAYRSAWLRRSGVLNDVSAQGFGFQVEMTRAAALRGARIVEVPITFDERRFGVSKLSGAIFSEELALVTRWGVGHWRRRIRQGLR